MPLSRQDRERWDAQLIIEGQALVRRCLRRDRPGPYQIQAAIAAVHSAARRAADTDWAQILQLYDQLTVAAPSPVVALNRAVALAELSGPAVALTEVDRLDLVGYHVYHVVRADLLARLGRGGEAVEAYRMAVARTDNAAERAFLSARATALATS
ncbi:hypothetical protein [Micromonospora sp. NPDC048839]|uniref:hypothetical protein n=1 Tax=Micromonospora sp. NPDC048839 TaxID=3155641 RepID=UPI0033FB1765